MAGTPGPPDASKSKMHPTPPPPLAHPARTTLLLIVLLLAGGVGVGCEGSVDFEPIAAGPLLGAESVGCELVMHPPGVDGQGERQRFEVTLTNRTDLPMWLPGSLDNSSDRGRYPYCYFEITGPSGWSPEVLLRCGNQNPMREQDFVLLRPGQAFDPHANIDNYGFFGPAELEAQTFSVPGTYQVQFFYSTNSRNLEEWKGSLNPEDTTPTQVMERWKRVPRVEVASNTVSFTVADPHAEAVEGAAGG